MENLTITSLRIEDNWARAFDPEGNPYDYRAGYVIQALQDGCNLYELQGVFPTWTAAEEKIASFPIFSNGLPAGDWLFIGSSR